MFSASYPKIPSINFEGLPINTLILSQIFFSSYSFKFSFSPIIIITNFPVTTTIEGGEPKDFISVMFDLSKQAIAFLALSLAGIASAKAYMKFKY